MLRHKKLLFISALELQKINFFRDPARIARKRIIGAYHPVARDDKIDAVFPYRRSDRLCGHSFQTAVFSDPFCDFVISRGSAALSMI